VLDVEVLDVNDTEARALLLAIDPLAQLADYDDQALTQLRSVAEADSAAIRGLWQTLDDQDAKVRKRIEEESEPRSESDVCPEKFFRLDRVYGRGTTTCPPGALPGGGLNCCCKII